MIKKIGILILLLCLLFFVYMFQNANKYKNPVIENIDIAPPASKEAITISLVGDIMIDRGVAASINKNFNGDFFKIFENVPELKETDITFGNLEGPITTSNDKRGSIYSFKMDPTVASVLSDAGFDIVSFANNHVGDYGKSGFLDTLNFLENNNVLFTGAGLNKTDASTARIVNVRGKKIGFLGFTDVGPDWMEAKDDTPGILLASDPDLEEIIYKEKMKVDYLLVSFHWGDEYVVTNDRQRELATKAVIFGADVVVGHHPHVIQEDILINGKPVLFSLGNFVFDQSTPEQTKVGMFAVISFNPDGTILLDRFSSDRGSDYRPGTLRLFEDRDLISSSVKKDNNKKIVFSCPTGSGDFSNLYLSSFPMPKPITKYTPDDLVLIPREYSVTKNICIGKSTYEAFLTMRKDMEGQGLLLLVRYGFRNNDLQEMLVSALTQKGRGSFVAPVGQSEHLLGTAFDFASGTKIGNFANSKEYQFLKENAHKYGFIQSFQGDHRDISKMPNEPWHWRFVGKNTATLVKNSGLPINLFLRSY